MYYQGKVSYRLKKLFLNDADDLARGVPICNALSTVRGGIRLRQAVGGVADGSMDVLSVEHWLPLPSQFPKLANVRLNLKLHVPSTREARPTIMSRSV